jgi:uncharacterized repeat protein (TIGR01451 family)
MQSKRFTLCLAVALVLAFTLTSASAPTLAGAPHSLPFVANLERSLTAPSACSERMVNGGFENGPGAGAAPWVISTLSPDDMIADYYPHSGTYHAWLLGYDDGVDTLYQTVSLPTLISSATLTYWWYMSTEDYPFEAYDVMTVTVRNSSGTLLQTLQVLSNQSAAEVWTQSTFNLAAFAGQTIRIQFHATSDSSYSTSFFVDDVSLNLCEATPQPDVSIVKRVIGSEFEPGEHITFTLSVANTGSAVATGVIVTDVVPSQVLNLTYANSLPITPTGVYSYVWNVGTLGIGQSGVITLYGQIDPGLPILVSFSNMATISTPQDTTPGNNTSRVTIGEWEIHLPLVMRDYCSQLTITDPDFTLYQSDMRQINADDAWLRCIQGANVVVAVIDSGVNLSHPDLAAHLISGYDFVDNDAVPEDGNGHGSNVAGIVGAALNGVGVVGVAPGARILPVRVLNNQGSGTSSWVADGITYAADRAQVLNISLGSVSSSSVIEDAVNYAASTKGRLVIVSAGNCGDNSYYLNGCTYRNQPSYPAAYSNVMAVAAVDSSDGRASFSTQGTYVDIAAPGVDIYSAYKNGGYTSESGTSQAAPHVAGLAALIWGENPSFTAAQVRSRIETMAVDLGTAGWDQEYGWGRIDAWAALGLTSAASVKAGAAAPTTPSAPVDHREAEIAPGRVLIKFQPGVGAASVDQKLSAFSGVSVVSLIAALDVHVLSVPQGQEWALVDQFRALPGVAYAEPDYIIKLIR